MSGTAGRPPGAERWLSVHDELLRGMAHAVSNRLATIAATAGVLETGVPVDGRLLDGLRHDAERLEGLLQQLRQLPRRVEPALEPMLFTDALDGARRLTEEHPDLRGRPITVAQVGDVQPVRAEPTAMVHAVAVALLAVARLGDGPLTADFETAGDEVRLTVRLASPLTAGEEHLAEDALEDAAHTIDWLLTASQGRAAVVRGGCALHVPTLQASRRRTG